MIGEDASCIFTELLNSVQESVARSLSQEEMTMKVVMDRDLCNASLPFCQRCSAAYIRHPKGSDRLCIREIVDDNSERLTLELRSDRRIREVELSDEQQQLAQVEGWEVLVDFDPALYRTGAMTRWRALRQIQVGAAA